VDNLAFTMPRALAEEADRALAELIAWASGYAAASGGTAPLPSGIHGVQLAHRIIRGGLDNLPSWTAEAMREERKRCVEMIREAGRQAVTPAEGARLMALANDIEGESGGDLRR
jgi:hypothetical protein